MRANPILRPRRSRPRLRAGRGNGGFSLIEVMIAVTFLGIGLLAIAQLIPYGLAGVTQARVRTNAVNAAQEKLDALSASDYNSAALTPGDYSETDGKYTLDWTVTDNQPIQGMKRVDLSVSWDEKSGTKTIQLNTYVNPTAE
jgi:prepilin-type N-terminal cleavage/methylation domain-containing protein